MKNLLLFLLLIVSTINIKAQDIQISFAGTGASSSVDSVKIENLTQGTSAKIKGTDVFYLSGSITGIVPKPDGIKSNLRISPNPLTESSIIDFKATSSGPATIDLFDLSGKKVASLGNTLAAGNHSFKVGGLSLGVYVLRIHSQDYSYAGKLLSNGTKGSGIKITYQGSNADPSPKLKNWEAVTTMPYNAGDQILFTGTSGMYSTVVASKPNQNSIITFNFMPCTDADSKNYRVVQIGNQVWMAENLKTTRYNDGSPIPNETDNSAWQHLSTPAFAWLNNDSATYHKTYGVLYNGFAVGTGKLAPKGWHVPSDDEWDTLVTYLGGPGVAGGKLKESGTAHWLSPNAGANNEVGFTALPGSEHEGAGMPGFGLIGRSAWWWSSTQNGNNNNSAGFIGVGSDYESIFKSNLIKSMGFSVRCIKDESSGDVATKLTGGASKTWVVDPTIQAHFGVGPWDNSSVTPAWWAAQINEKLICCPCFYTSKFTFTKIADDNYTLTVATPDGAFTKTGILAGGLPGIPASGDEACYNYAGGISDFSLIPASSGIPAPTSTKTSILLPGVNTFIGYGATLKEYEILKITDSTLYLRVQGTETGNAWYLKLKKYETPIIDIRNTTWDVTIFVSSIASFHGDVTFNPDGTTLYDEPSSPGSFLSHGSWTLTGDKIHFSIDNTLPPDSYVFDGTIVGNNMSGTYVFNLTNHPWSAVKKDDSGPNNINNTTWDATIIYDANTFWHADVTFNADGTTKYDEPDYPGIYLKHGVWSRNNDQIHWDIGNKTDFIYDGTITGNKMIGTFYANGASRTWNAVKK